jgi:hypothetical protein
VGLVERRDAGDAACIGALGRGFLGIWHRWKGLLMFSLTAPYLLAIIGVFAILALD